MADSGIVAATAAHLEQLVDLLLQLEEAMEHPAPGSSPSEETAALIRANLAALLEDPAAYVLVAEEAGGRAVGLVSFSQRRTLLHPGPSALIDELVVDAAARGAGWGRRLIQATCDEARRRGCCEVEVSTEKSNGAARDFYRSVGFDEDAVLLERDL